MKLNFDCWNKTGLLETIPEERKLLVSNSLELLTKYLIGSGNDENRFVTLIIPIFCRIGREVDFGINDFFQIIKEVQNEIKDVQSNEEEIFVAEYSERKILKFM